MLFPRAVYWLYPTLIHQPRPRSVLQSSALSTLGPPSATAGSASRAPVSSEGEQRGSIPPPTPSKAEERCLRLPGRPMLTVG